MNWAKTKILHEYSRFWDENLGCVFIPWDMMSSVQLGSFLEGCIIDEDTLPPGYSMPTPTSEYPSFPYVLNVLPEGLVLKLLNLLLLNTCIHM